MKDKDYGDGKTEATLENISDDLRVIHDKLDAVIDDHGNRLTAIETTGKVFKWILSIIGVTSIAAFLKSIG